MPEFYSVKFNNSKDYLTIESDDLAQAKAAACRQGALRGAKSFTIGQVGAFETIAI